MGDTTTKFVNNVTCTSGNAENIHFALSRRYINNLLTNPSDNSFTNFKDHMILTSYYKGLDNSENIKITKNIKTFIGDTELLLEEDFISFYEILVRTRDAIESKKVINSSTVLLYFKDMNVNTPEGNNIKVTNGRYFTKSLYLTKLTNFIRNSNSVYDEELYISYPSPLFSNGYDWTVYKYKYNFMYFIDK